jgi:riboflavin biosynthesis pyrimidine reductase
LQPKNQLAKQFSLSPAEVISEIASNFEIAKTKPINLLIEAGPKLLLEMVRQGLIDNLYLTVNQEKGGENQISISDLTKSFELISSEEISPCQFRYYKKLAN